jgi:DNA-binding NarL/FixJ family response regulator
MVAGDATRALVLEAAAGAQRTSAGADITPEWSKEVLDSIERAKAKVGPTAAEAATRRGAAMTMKEAVAYALGETTGARRDGGMRLSDREIQVARLVAEGLTNGEVGGRLRISERTVDAHVEHIRNKLGLRTRAQIAVWAKERLGTA